MPDRNEANTFLDKLNSCHRNLKFTMEIAEQNTIPFVGMNIIKSGNKLETSVYRKSTNTGLLLHYHSHVDKRYKDCLLTTMIHRAYQLSSTPTAFSAGCNKLHSTFPNLDYPINLINSAINTFLRNIDNIDAAKNTRDDSSTIIVPLPFNALVIGFPEGLMWGLANCAFQSSCISPPVGAFFLAKSPLFGEAKHPTGFEDALQNFILVL